MTFQYRSTLLLAWTLLILPSRQASGQIAIWKKGQKSIDESIIAQSADGSVSQSPSAPVGSAVPNAPRIWKFSAAAEPTPALKYRFSIPKMARRSGDAKSQVDRAVMMYLQHPDRKQLDAQYLRVPELFGETSSELLFSDASKQELREYLNSQSGVLKQLHEALSFEMVRVDHRLRDLRGQDVLANSLIDVQNLRAMANLLRAECRLAIAEHRFEDAIRACRDGFRIAEIVIESGESSVVEVLVGMSIIGQVHESIERIILSSGPNLYWALASIPIDKYCSLQFTSETESISWDNALFPWGVEDVAATESQAGTRLIELTRLFQNIAESRVEPHSDRPNAKDQLLGLGVLVLFADQAKRQLGRKEIGNCQAILEWTQRDFVRSKDDLMKWMSLPTHERYLNRDRIAGAWNSFAGFPDSPAKVLLSIAVPGLQATDEAVRRVQRRHALLMTVEAIRAYAASNDGTLPLSLADLQPLPAVVDATTGELFKYRLTDQQHAVLTIEKSTGIPHEYQVKLVP